MKDYANKDVFYPRISNNIRKDNLEGVSVIEEIITFILVLLFLAMTLLV